MNAGMAAACCPTEHVEEYESWTHYRAPSWWDAEFYRPDRVDESARSMAGASRK